MDLELLDSRQTHWPAPKNQEFGISGQSDISPEEVRRILLERAREYAEVVEEESESRETICLITFSICGENYGIELRYINKVRILPQHITPIPCTPLFVKGAVNILGKIFTVIDVRTFLNISSDAQNEFKKVLIVETADLELGILVDEIISVVDLTLAEIKPPTDILSHSRTEHIRGVTEDMLIILDIESLFGTPDIIVNEEI